MVWGVWVARYEFHVPCGAARGMTRESYIRIFDWNGCGRLRPNSQRVYIDIDTARHVPGFALYTSKHFTGFNFPESD